MLNINVIHYTKLKDRKNNILNIFKNKNVNLNFIEIFDAEEINKDNIKNFYNPNIDVFNHKVKLWEHSSGFRYLSYGETSVAIKQTLAIKKIAEMEDDYGLIVEDDIMPYQDNFLDIIIENIKNVPNDWDAIFIGNGCGDNFIHNKLKNAQKINDFIFKPLHPVTNCAEAYLLKKHSAEKIYKNILPFQLAFDWELAYQFYELNMNVYWIYPSIFYQGSNSGEYKSSLRNNLD
jgi:GR25 family glycosyltransferase involved in LPS biosynthesis